MPIQAEQWYILSSRITSEDLMKLRLALEEKLMDARLRDRLLAENKISKEEVKKYVDSLPDDAKSAVPLDPEEAKNLQ